ncbi:MAG: TonB-dependent receptor [Proteobacteria bacterium]|nr:TonB-dependent receptor [Pseudomonadota bacterium]
MTDYQRHFSALLAPMILAVTCIGSTLFTANAVAQERRGSANILLEEIIVTARKREENAQEVPIAITAFNAEQIESLKIRDLMDLSVGMPNVALDDIGTFRGSANFSIRGLGINSSIPSIDPTVGVFIDGIYLGNNVGTIFDMFDVESVTVLRGPQGILFGRNVTGGAILINTRKPGDEFETSIRAAVDGGGDGGQNRYLMGSIGGPVSDTLRIKLTAYYNDDDGWFENQFDGSDFGAIQQTMIRPVLVWSPTDNTELILRYEYTDIDGDGPASQTHTNGSGVPGFFANFDRDSHDFSIDDPGFQKVQTDFFSAELNIDVAFGDGTITNIFGWRKSEIMSRSDIDAQPVWLFHAPAWLNTEQVSNEVRYNGLFADDRANVTVGVYYFTNEINYHERRELLGIATGGVAPAVQLDGGGDYEVDSLGVFAAVDYELSDQWTLTAGLRFTREEKDANVAALIFNVNSPCNIVTTKDCPFDFTDSDKWTSVSPKIGATYHVDDDSLVYGHWSQGVRSGGYNLRNTSANPANTPGPFDEETVDSFEIGYKSTRDWGRLNAAVFYNTIDDMQRELNLPNEGAGVVQLIRNTADATITGLEIDGAFSLTDNVLLLASLGVINSDYDEVREDLNNDGFIDELDKALDLPRAADLTWSIGFTHDLNVGQWGYLSSRINYAYRDESAYTDSNLGFITEQKILDAGLDFHSNDGHWVFSLYGRNLQDEVKHGGDTQLPDFIGPVPTGGTFSPLARGRVFGVEVTYRSRGN